MGEDGAMQLASSTSAATLPALTSDAASAIPLASPDASAPNGRHAATSSYGQQSVELSDAGVPYTSAAGSADQASSISVDVVSVGVAPLADDKPVV